MLLDCDEVLAQTAYGSTRAWAGSTLQAWVTIGDDGTFGAGAEKKKGAFTAPEKAAIAQSATTAGEDPAATDKLGADFRLTSEQAFVLSVGEANAYYADSNASKKTGGYGYWWLRSAGTDPIGACVAVVLDDGDVDSNGWSVNDDIIGASPAFNINLKSVIFSSLISGVAGQLGAEYKLTIKDADLGASGSASLKCTQATVTYTTTGDAATQASYLVTDNAWDDGWPAGAAVLAYGKLGDAEEVKGTFDLLDGCATEGWGTDYHVYVLAEAVSGGAATDYASAPVEVAKPAPATFAVKVAEGIQGGTVTVKTADGKQIETEDGSFAMPVSDVTVSATFAKTPGQTPEPTPEPTPTPAAAIVPAISDHVQNAGAMGWACDGQDAGTSGLSLRAEAIDVQILPQGQVPVGYDGSAACVTR